MNEGMSMAVIGGILYVIKPICFAIFWHAYVALFTDSNFCFNRLVPIKLSRVAINSPTPIRIQGITDITILRNKSLRHCNSR